MKKFLSLVLALVMTMSLVTISAGATEYKDLTDKDEIQYEEAVAVLNRIGIITGYEDGSFRPETELTRGAAAKIIVSLMIGPEAAANIPNNSSPYPDVPAGHTFAGVISYCKTAGYISGYGDGTFKPANSLTGYAFAKMLLGALGYKSELEGFTGTGWTMNVARLGNEAGLFDRLQFKGADSVNREQACQLALNTLKGTMVEYTGGFTVNAGDATVTGGQTRTYKTSNQEFATHISNRKAGNTQAGNAVDNHWTVEFGEEHFVDLRMDNDRNADDAFGRPSNKWSFKKVTIGTYPVAADFTFDHQIAHREESEAVRKRATGLSSYTLEKAVVENGVSRTYRTRLWVNGLDCGNAIDKIEQIADLTDNGAVVEVYVSDTMADFIQDVVVIQTQLMEVKRVGKDYVSLQMEGNKKADSADAKTGYNVPALNVAVQDVQEEDSAYKLLSGLKAEDLVAVVPVAIDHGETYDVFEAYVPEKVSGKVTGVSNYGKTASDTNAIGLTVGGTEYKIAQWNRDLITLTAQKIKVTKKDVTLFLDKAGNALKAKDVGATDDWMVIGNFRQTMENGRIVTVINGWDISGTELSLNVGPNFDRGTGDAKLMPGDLVHYTSTSSNIAEWDIDEDSVFTVFAGTDASTSDPYMIKTSNDQVQLRGYKGNGQAKEATTDGTTATNNVKEYFDKGVKFIYVTFNNDHEVESIEVKKTVQEVKNSELLTAYKESASEPDLAANDDATDNGYNRAQAAVKLKGGESVVKAVVIKSESNDAIATNMLYVKDWHGGAGYDADGKMIYKYTVAMNSKDGVSEKTIYSDKELARGDFASYAESENGTFSPFYKLSKQNDQIGRTTSTFCAEIDDTETTALRVKNKNLVKFVTTGYTKVQGGALASGPKIKTNTDGELGVGNSNDTATLRNAEWVDLVTKNDRINNVDELAKYKDVKVALVVNDNEKNDGFRQVSMIVVLEGTAKTDDAVTPTVELRVQTVAGGGALPANPVGATAPDLSLGYKLILDAVVTNASDCKTLTYTWYHDGETYGAPVEKSGSGRHFARLVVDLDDADAVAGTWTVTVKNTDTTKEDSQVSAAVSPAKVTDASGAVLSTTEGANAAEGASAFVIGTPGAGGDAPAVTDPDAVDTSDYDVTISGLTLTLVQKPGADELTEDGAMLDMIEAILKEKGKNVQGLKAGEGGAYIITVDGREYTFDPSTNIVTQVTIYVNGVPTAVADDATLNTVLTEAAHGKWALKAESAENAASMTGDWLENAVGTSVDEGKYYVTGYFKVTDHTALTDSSAQTGADTASRYTSAVEYSEDVEAGSGVHYVKKASTITITLTCATAPTATKADKAVMTVSGAAVDPAATTGFPNITATGKVGDFVLTNFTADITSAPAITFSTGSAATSG